MEVVDAVGSRSAPAIAIDDAGVITIVASPNVYTAVNVNVYRRAPGGLWQTTAVAGPRFPSAPWLALALDSAAQPHLVALGGYDGSQYSFTYGGPIAPPGRPARAPAWPSPLTANRA